MAKTFLALVKSAESSVTQGGADTDVKSLFNSVRVEQHGSRVALTATVPQGFIRKALTPPGTPTATPSEAPPKLPEKKQKKK
jgi:hypothetical protein